jgi:hypothetical protein
MRDGLTHPWNDMIAGAGSLPTLSGTNTKNVRCFPSTVTTIWLIPGGLHKVDGGRTRGGWVGGGGSAPDLESPRARGVREDV